MNEQRAVGIEVAGVHLPIDLARMRELVGIHQALRRAAASDEMAINADEMAGELARLADGLAKMEQAFLQMAQLQAAELADDCDCARCVRRRELQAERRKRLN